MYIKSKPQCSIKITLLYTGIEHFIQILASEYMYIYIHKILLREKDRKKATYVRNEFHPFNEESSASLKRVPHIQRLFSVFLS